MASKDLRDLLPCLCLQSHLEPFLCSPWDSHIDLLLECTELRPLDLLFPLSRTHFSLLVLFIYLLTCLFVYLLEDSYLLNFCLHHLVPTNYISLKMSYLPEFLDSVILSI